MKAGGDLVNRGPNARSSLHYTPEDLENSTPIPPDPPFRALRRLLTLLAALLAGVAAGLIVPVLAGFGERGLAVGIATTALILLGVGIRDRVRDPDGRAGSLFNGPSTSGETMKRLLAAAALAAALSCSAAGTQDIQKHGEEYFRIFSILPDGQGILARRCTKLTQSGLCVGAPVLLPADAVKAPAEEKVVRLADPKEDGWHTLQHDNGQKKTVMKMTGREVTE